MLFRSLFSIVRLIDDIKDLSTNYQVVEYWRYPYYPEKNVVTLSSTAPKIQNTIKDIKFQIENPNSSFQQGIQNLLNALGDSIAGFNGGNLLITQNEKGQPNGLKIMDTADEATAKKVLYFNLEGIAYSSNGANGPFDSVWSFEENGFVANWIVVGNLTANIIKGGTLTLGGPGNGNGVCSVLDAAGIEIMRISQSGIRCDSPNGTFQNIQIYYDYNSPSSLNDKCKSVMNANGYESFYDGVEGLISTEITGSGVGSTHWTGTSADSPGTGSGTWHINYLGEATFKSLSVSGSKNRAVKTEHYGTRLMNAYETADALFGDVGQAEIGEDGKCIVEIDPIFSETVSLDCYIVFLQAEGRGECFVSEKKADCFVVEGTPGLPFAYEIKAKQKGFESVRLEEKS